MVQLRLVDCAIVVFSLIVCPTVTYAADAVQKEPALQELRAHLALITERRNAIEARYPGAGWADLGKLYDSFRAALREEEAIRNSGLPRHRAITYAQEWGTWLALDYRDVAAAIYGTHATALQDSIKNVEDIGSASRIDLDALKQAVAAWRAHETQFVTAVTEALERLRGRLDAIMRRQMAHAQDCGYDKACTAERDVRIKARTEEYNVAAHNAGLAAEKMKAFRKVFFEPIGLIKIELAEVNDQGRQERDAARWAPILKAQGERAAWATQVGALQTRFDNAKIELDTASGALEQALATLEQALRGVKQFRVQAMNDNIAALRKEIERLKREGAPADKVSEAEARLGRWTKDGLQDGELEENYAKTPTTISLANEAKRAREAVQAAAVLRKERDGKTDAAHWPMVQLNIAIARLEEIDAEILAHYKKMIETTAPAITKLEVIVENSVALRALYDPDPAAAPVVAALRAVEDQLKLVEIRRRLAKEGKEAADQAWLAEAKAALAAGEKLGGWTGAIMVNAYTQSLVKGSNVLVGAVDGGFVGAFVELAKLATEVATKAALSGGENLGLDEVDEKKIEARVLAASVGVKLNDVPTIDWLKSKAVGTAAPWLATKGGGFLASATFSCAIKASDELALATGAPLAQGAFRKYLAEPGGISKAIAALRSNTKFTDLGKAFGRTAAIAVAQYAVKKAVEKREEELWTAYFEHDLKARALLELKRAADEFYRVETANYEQLQAKHAQLLQQLHCARTEGLKVVYSQGMRVSKVDRPMSIVVSLQPGVAAAKMRVSIRQDVADLNRWGQDVQAQFVAPDRFNGKVLGGTPDDYRVHVGVTVP